MSYLENADNPTFIPSFVFVALSSFIARVWSCIPVRGINEWLGLGTGRRSICVPNELFERSTRKRRVMPQLVKKTEQTKYRLAFEI